MNNFKVNQFYVKNQFVLSAENITIFQSYESTICKIENNYKITLYQDFDYSKTTSRYLHQFLNEFTCYDLYDFIKKNDIRKNKSLQYGKYYIVFEE